MTAETRSSYLNKLTFCPSLIKDAPEEIKNDKDAAKIVLNKNGVYLLFFSDKIKDDKDLIMIALNNSVLSIQHASKRFRSNRNLMMMLANINPITIEFCDESLFKDEIFAKFVAENYRDHFFGFSPEIKNNEFLKEMKLDSIYNPRSTTKRYFFD